MVGETAISATASATTHVSHNGDGAQLCCGRLGRFFGGGDISVGW